MADLDEALDIAITNKGGIYVGRVTAKGFRHFFYYVDFDEQTADAIAAEVSASQGHSLDLAYVEDPSKEKAIGKTYIRLMIGRSSAT